MLLYDHVKGVCAYLRSIEISNKVFFHSNCLEFG